AQLAERARRNAVEAAFGNQRSARRLADEDRSAVVSKGRETADSHAFYDDGQAVRLQRESGQSAPCSDEDLQPASILRRIGDDEGVVGTDIEGVGLKNAAGFGADVD